jgi:hypothetical protein
MKENNKQPARKGPKRRGFDRRVNNFRNNNYGYGNQFNYNKQQNRYDSLQKGGIPSVSNNNNIKNNPGTGYNKNKFNIPPSQNPMKTPFKKENNYQVEEEEQEDGDYDPQQQEDDQHQMWNDQWNEGEEHDYQEDNLETEEDGNEDENFCFLDEFDEAWYF